MSKVQDRAATRSLKEDLTSAYAAAAFSGLFFRMAKSRSSTCGDVVQTHQRLATRQLTCRRKTFSSFPKVSQAQAVPPPSGWVRHHVHMLSLCENKPCSIREHLGKASPQDVQRTLALKVFLSCSAFFLPALSRPLATVSTSKRRLPTWLRSSSRADVLRVDSI